MREIFFYLVFRCVAFEVLLFQYNNDVMMHTAYSHEYMYLEMYIQFIDKYVSRFEFFPTIFIFHHHSHIYTIQYSGNTLDSGASILIWIPFIVYVASLVSSFSSLNTEYNSHFVKRNRMQRQRQRQSLYTNKYSPKMNCRNVDIMEKRKYNNFQFLCSNCLYPFCSLFQFDEFLWSTQFFLSIPISLDYC